MFFLNSQKIYFFELDKKNREKNPIFLGKQCVYKGIPIEDFNGDSLVAAKLHLRSTATDTVTRIAVRNVYIYI